MKRKQRRVYFRIRDKTRFTSECALWQIMTKLKYNKRKSKMTPKRSRMKSFWLSCLGMLEAGRAINAVCRSKLIIEYITFCFQNSVRVIFEAFPAPLVPLGTTQNGQGTFLWKSKISIFFPTHFPRIFFSIQPYCYCL